ncbi:MAG: DNA polymerase IV [Myxococcota bacterium]
MDERTILHVDMDAFYASVEQHDDPSIRGKPVIVGGGGTRGVVSAASYEVRPFGVHSAMSMVEALRRCPDAVVVTPRMERYQEVSEVVFAVFRRYTPAVEGLSLDEAFLEVTGSRTLFGDGETIARRVKEEIFAETGLRASAGVALNKFVAKVCSDLEKPDGLVVAPREAEALAAFLAPLAIERMWGVGPKAAARLHACGFRTFGDLAKTSADALEAVLGSWGRHVHQLAQGEDVRSVITSRGAKSMGAEETFSRDLRRIEDIERYLLRQSARIAGRLVNSGLQARCITVKVKFRDHRSQTRQRHIPDPVSDTDSIFAVARELLGRFSGLERGIRLTGVSASDFVPAGPSMELFPDEQKQRREKLEAVTQALQERFGRGSLKRARLVDGSEREGYDGVDREALQAIVDGRSKN